MSARGLLFGAGIGLLLIGVGYATAPFPTESDPTVVGQRTTRKLQNPMPFRQYPGVEYYDFPLPPDYATPGEWVFARFMYRAIGYGRRSRSNWTIDYPRSDRHLIGRRSPANACRCAIRRTTSSRGRWRRHLQLAMAVRRRSRTLGSDGSRSSQTPRLLAARRVLHV